MPRALDRDLRDRVIDAVLQGGMSRRGAAADLKAQLSLYQMERNVPTAPLEWYLETMNVSASLRAGVPRAMDD